MARTSFVSILLCILLASGSALAAAASSVAEIAESLRRDPVFVDPDAERAIDVDDADRLRDEIRDAGSAIFVAVVPAGNGRSRGRRRAAPSRDRSRRHVCRRRRRQLPRDQ